MKSLLKIKDMYLLNSYRYGKQVEPIIDIRSDFGVTKDASNNVISVALANNPSLLFTNVSASCVENGNGIDFNGNTGAGRLQGASFDDLTGNWFVGWWGKYTSSPLTGSKATFGCYPPSDPSVYCFLSATTNRMNISLDGVTITSEDAVRINPTLTDWNYFGIEKVGTQLFFTKNGFLSGDATGITSDFITNLNDMHIANLGGVNNFSVNDFAVDNFQIFPDAIHSYSGKTYLDKIYDPINRASA